MRAVLATVVLVAGCAELGTITDGTSISVGKPSGGYLIDGVRIPDEGDGFCTREVWKGRNNRYGTDELIDLVTQVAKRMHKRFKDVRIVVADLSGRTGGGAGAWQFHRSHQSGRDADLLYYMRDANGQPFEPDAMHQFNARGYARDGSGLRVDVARTWALVKELVDAPEAPVQYIFMYEPIAQMLIDHAKEKGEPMDVIVRVRKALKQPGDSAKHDDHMHVRVYCAPADREYGCIDIGPMDLLAEREAEQAAQLAAVAAALPSAPAVAATKPSAADVWLAGPANVAQASAASESPSVSIAPPPVPPVLKPVDAVGGGAAMRSVGSLLRAGPDRIDLRGWR